MKSANPRLGAALISLVVLVTACGTSTAETGKPLVAAAFYPLQWLSERVGGQDASVKGLTEPGVEPHDLELTPRQVGDVQDASLIVYVKGVQPAVDEAVARHAADSGFDAAAAVPTLKEPEGGEHGGVSYDPHIWLDPSRLATIATALGERLATADPAHAAAYEQRAAALAAELKTLDGEYRNGLATCASREIVTSHESFAYLADRYRLTQIGVVGVDPDGEPSPARLEQVAATARERGVTTIFTEELVSPKVAEVLADEIGAKTAVLNPLESPPASGDYLSAARANLSTLRTALGCQ